MEDLTNLDENKIQLMDLPEISESIPHVISFYNPEVMAVEDDDELMRVDQFHEEELGKPRKLISCGDKSSRSSSIEQEGSRCKKSDIMAVLENDENNPDYTRSNNSTKSWSADGGWWMPEHLLFDILILLPVATLLRFKSVCKLWYALISSSNFIAQHLDCNCGKDNFIGFHDPVYKHHEIISYKSCLLSGNRYENYCNFDCENFVKDPIRSERFSSDGIVCIVLYNLRQVVVDLWNPVMKQLRRLPESEQLRRLPKPSFSLQFFDYFISYGFGYSVRSDDYKVVRTFVHTEKADNNVVEVYSLRADSWRTIIEDGVLSFKSISKPVSRNGTCFWIGSNNPEGAEYHDESVVSFDLNDETFGTTPLPENTSDFSALDFLGEKLAFISGLKNPNIYNFGSSYYEIWVLHEYGVKESWSKIWKIGPTNKPYSNDVYCPFGFSINGDYLLLSTNSLNSTRFHSGDIYMYNLGTQENEYIKLGPLDREVYLFVRCMESLVSVKRVDAAKVLNLPEITRDENPIYQPKSEI